MPALSVSDKTTQCHWLICLQPRGTLHQHWRGCGYACSSKHCRLSLLTNEGQTIPDLMASLDYSAHWVRHLPVFSQVFDTSARVYGRALLSAYKQTCWLVKMRMFLEPLRLEKTLRSSSPCPNTTRSVSRACSSCVISAHDVASGGYAQGLPAWTGGKCYSHLPEWSGD